MMQTLSIPLKIQMLAGATVFLSDLHIVCKLHAKKWVISNPFTLKKSIKSNVFLTDCPPQNVLMWRVVTQADADCNYVKGKRRI